MTRNLFRVTVVVAAVALLVPMVASAQAIIKVNDNINFRFGFQLQGRADWDQSASGEQPYSQNLYIRRVRFLVAGNVAKDVSFFFETDHPGIGKAPNASCTKGMSCGFIMQDAFGEWRIANEFILGGGLYVIPFARNELQSTLRYITLDLSPTSIVFAAPTQTSGTRDTGFFARGLLVDGGRLEYRASVTQGVRDAQSRNSFRFTGYLQYNFLEKEGSPNAAILGYVFNGTNLGTKKVFGISAGVDSQKQYSAYSAATFGTLPVGAGDEVAFLGQWCHYDGGTFVPTLPQQNDYLAELGYYLKAAQIQPFVKYEAQRFSQTDRQGGDVDRYALGLNYSVAGQSLKFTAQYQRVEPKTKTPTFQSTNQFYLQMQIFYF